MSEYRYPNEHQLFAKLKMQRHKQIIRQGVSVTYRFMPYPYRRYFAFDLISKSQLIDLLKEKKYPLQLCSLDGTPVMKISPSQLYFSKQLQDSGKLFLSSNIYATQSIITGEEYFLVKSNPTITAYKDNLSQDDHLFTGLQFVESSHIMSYFKGETQQIQSLIKLQFPQQKDLNQKQNQAIYKSGFNSLTFIKGPPGCGKTKTIARLCKLFIESQLKVIVGAVSNTGNLSIVRSLIDQLSIYNQHNQILKLYQQYGQSNQQYYYYLLSQHYDEYIRCSLVFYPPFDMNEEQLPPLIRIYCFDTILLKNMIAICCRSETYNIAGLLYQYKLLKQKKVVQNKFYAILMQATGMITANAHIVISTTVKSKSINSKLAEQLHFMPHVAILDQASQSSISDTLCYLKLNIHKLILVGDQKQLAPTVITNDQLLKQTLFNKFATKKQEYFTMLNKQYRMHPQISCLANELFYSSQINDGITVFDRLSDIFPFCNHPVLFVNCPYLQRQAVDQTQKGGKKTYVNYHQVHIIKIYIQRIPVKQLKNVGIITPYAEQLKLLQKCLSKQVRDYGLTIKTCDGYQGGEKDYIFISLVRSNQDGNIGFCIEQTRINVSITRARRGLMIIGSAATFIHSPNYWGAIILKLGDRQGYFNYQLPISQVEIQNLIQIHQQKQIAKEQASPLISAQQQYMNKIYPYESYREQFIQQYPNHTQDIIQAYYTHHINNLIYSYTQPNYLMQQIQNKKEQNRQNIIAILNDEKKEEEDSDDQSQMGKFNKKNKGEVKKLRSLDFLRTTNNFSIATPQEYLAQIQYIFSTIPNNPQQLNKRFTKVIRQQYLPYFKQLLPNNSHQNLTKLVQQISRPSYSQNHLKNSENIYKILKWCLLDRLFSYL